jgi:uncharacterized protein YciI
MPIAASFQLQPRSLPRSPVSPAYPPHQHCLGPNMAAQLHDWIVRIPDRNHAGALQIRQDNFAAHVAHNKAHVEAGRVVMSGPVLASHPKTPDEPLAPVGSVMVWKAGSEAEVRAWLSEDPYATQGAWDLDGLDVSPFFCAVRRPL